MSNEHNNNAPAVPQGWRLVPIEPTKEMLDAGLKRKAQARWIDGASVLRARTENLRPAEEIAALQWDAMLAVSPAPAPAQERCHLCDCTGDIHDATGEWRGECPYCKPAKEVTQSEPIYQLQRGDGSWIDQDKASYDYNAQYGINTIRIVYTAPEPAQEVGLTDRQFDLICQAIDRGDTVTMDGDYMLDSDDCIRVVRVMQVLFDIAALRAKGGK